MIVLLNILKIIGIILLCILSFILVLLLLILFVPVRYRLKAVRKEQDDAMVHADAKVTWLLHLLSASFRYPEAAYLKVRVFGIPVYSTEKKEQDKTEQDKNEQDKSEQSGQELDRVKSDEAKQKEITEEKAVEKQEEKQEELEKLLEEKIKEDEEEPTLIRFLKKLLEKLIKIKYTILQICDKIKHIVKNVRYYVAIMKSNCFQRAFSLCKEEVFSLIKSIMPRKLKGNFLIGTGDPASTAQILAVHGMLYPFIGNHITVVPDFENTVIEGDLFIKGRITVFKILKTAVKVYFNKDVRKVLRLLKREAA
ncbi:MAG: DUF2953 domain-containing protein [Lachnospiraceae bacterium]|nr:DUF2953 domain-containing protein [Lachnospiraceae bacterium]